MFFSMPYSHAFEGTFFGHAQHIKNQIGSKNFVDGITSTNPIFLLLDFFSGENSNFFQDLIHFLFCFFINITTTFLNNKFRHRACITKLHQISDQSFQRLLIEGMNVNKRIGKKAETTYSIIDIKLSDMMANKRNKNSIRKKRMFIISRKKSRLHIIFLQCPRLKIFKLDI